VYAPTNTTTSSKLPVYFFIQGGGFNADSNPNFNGTGLIQASGMNIVVINFNYRVGPYGFLASKEVMDGGSLNNGLKDQIKALQWVQKYIGGVRHPPSTLVNIDFVFSLAETRTMWLSAGILQVLRR
jgi:carboxylesterase type B